ncbi:L-rhamnose operon regulatory protein [Escherichia coli]|uniref:L-rhamnose operon regulatory protein n=1 Tax=Escherichia coli TaxID=562 RepID=A0A376RRF5_ECOLX|nr:L-rhamnose operon regulatory protein [Escherichia coli]
MTVLHSVDFFPSGNASVAIEPRLPQADFPEHHHDFHEIVIVEHGTGIHVFNGQPYTITGGTVCFVRDHDRHLYEHTDNLCLTNVLYRSPDRFQFLAGLNQLLPQELDGQYPSHWRVNHSVLQQVRQLVAQMEQQEGENDLPSTASREILFMQLLLLLRKSSLQENLENSASRLNLLLAWLEDHFADEVNGMPVAEQFSLSLRTLHRQLKQQTGLTPQRYLNRLRLMKPDIYYATARPALLISPIAVDSATVTTFRRFFAESLTGHRVILSGTGWFSAITRIFSTYLYAILRIINFVLWPR